MKTFMMTSLVAAIGFAAGACRSSDPRITPAEETNTVSPTMAEVDTPLVKVGVKSEDWHGFPAELEERVTPLHIEIENQSNEPIYFGYAQMKLVEEDGSVHHALPPFEIDEEVVVNEPFEPRFLNQNFAVTSQYRRAYPGFGVTSYIPEPPPTFDYAAQYRLWGVDLPTVEMVRSALPEGVIEPGGSIDGYVYFEHVDTDAKTMTFVYQAQGVRSNESVADITVVFDVEEGA